MIECRWCKEGNAPEWSTDEQGWIHRLDSVDRRCENPPAPPSTPKIAYAKELNVGGWKQKLTDLGTVAYRAYFAGILGTPQPWERLTPLEREGWTLAALAIAEVLCPHDDKTVTSTGNIWCNKCGWQVPKEKF